MSKNEIEIIRSSYVLLKCGFIILIGIIWHFLVSSFGLIIIFVLPNSKQFLLDNGGFLSYVLRWGFWLFCVLKICFLILKCRPDLKLLIYTTFVVFIFSISVDLYANFFHLYRDANFFFNKPRIDILSHICSGMSVFLLTISVFSVTRLRFRIENVTLILTNFILFCYEIQEEIAEVFLKSYFPEAINPFFWNSIQDIIVNLIGSLIVYFAFKKYLLKRIPKYPEIKFISLEECIVLSQKTK